MIADWILFAQKFPFLFLSPDRLQPWLYPGPSPTGQPMVPGPPIWNLCPPISRLTPWLLHTSNTVFLKRGPPSGFWPPCCCILATGLVIPYTSRPPVFHCCPDTKKFCGKVINRLFVVRKLGMVVCEVKFWNITYFQIIITRTKGWRPESKDTKSYE